MYYETSVRIAAPAERVWAVLRDVERWPEWTPTMSQVHRIESAPEYVPGADGPTGELSKGDVVTIKQPRLPTASWTVTAWNPGASFAWTSTNGGTRTVADHQIAPDPDGTSVTVTLSIRQTGPLAGLIALLAGGLTRRYVDTEAASLKSRCEQP
ncbi:SRPBCC family protein [Frankia sp. CNm7]|uniref:SRPBCC family protein n=1 Tax=Frankia nepalensis TaxID=1836974 RepID=A0A937UQQ3_9ACTN|nr:SRPBCC family protein [Frankia nepalensis]MBL7496874.1 SRPBCC family protein [Frankia nepalensis]MBL7512074.1 SRPBCC family protein [Frankia nepalensis]MBL7524205.1 SRPBCC family protein [Frankia nepalensis]MBL7630467.1 SRPBCC family protein [Frankia nepalensis]